MPNEPIVPFIEGDGTGPDIWRASKHVLDGAVAKAYGSSAAFARGCHQVSGGSRKIAWLEVLAGEKAFRATGQWLPEATLDAYRKHLVGIKGPLTTPIGGPKNHSGVTHAKP